MRASDPAVPTASNVRLVVWNCAGGLAGKLPKLLELHPDVAVVPEACRPERLPTPLRDEITDCRWSGELPYKGVAVLTFGRWRLDDFAGPVEPRLQWILPVEVRGPLDFTLVGVWAQTGRLKDPVRARTGCTTSTTCSFPQPWVPGLRRVTIGDHATWGAAPPHSDHAPIVVDLDLDVLGGRAG